MQKRPILVGGSHDGESPSLDCRIDDKHWPTLLYFKRKLTDEERDILKITDTYWLRMPEDVYEMKDGKYRFRETVYYDPEHCSLKKS